MLYGILPGGSDGKESACNTGDRGLIPGSGRSPEEGNGYPTPIFLLGEFHRQRNLVGCSPWGCKESDMTEQLTFRAFPVAQMVKNLPARLNAGDVGLIPGSERSPGEGNEWVQGRVVNSSDAEADCLVQISFKLFHTFLVLYLIF